MKAAYRDFLAHDRFPQVIIFIDAPYNDIDVNVHPTKNEVRFKNSSLLRSSLISSIRATLSMAGHRATSTNSSIALQSFKAHPKSHQIDFQRSQLDHSADINDAKTHNSDKKCKKEIFAKVADGLNTREVRPKLLKINFRSVIFH